LLVAAVGAVAAMAITTTTQAAGEGINLSANTINVLAPKTPSKEITPSQGIEGDPIFAAIEAHRKADAVADVAFAESSRLYQLACEMVGPSHIEVPNMVEPGATAKVRIFYDVEQVIPHEQYPDLNDHY
jgi:hypothetical protein